MVHHPGTLEVVRMCDGVLAPPALNEDGQGFKKNFEKAKNDDTIGIWHNIS